MTDSLDAANDVAILCLDTSLPEQSSLSKACREFPICPFLYLSSVYGNYREKSKILRDFNPFKSFFNDYITWPLRPSLAKGNNPSLVNLSSIKGVSWRRITGLDCNISFIACYRYWKCVQLHNKAPILTKPRHPVCSLGDFTLHWNLHLLHWMCRYSLDDYTD